MTITATATVEIAADVDAAAPAARGAVRDARARILLAPVTVTPSKPLTPSHLKGLLWTDVMYRACRLSARVDFRASHSCYHQTEQTLGFWEFLDRAVGDVDYGEFDEQQIGALYMRFRADRSRPPSQALHPYAAAVEQGWAHPSAARMLELWRGHYATLGLHDPGLGHWQPPGYSMAEVVDLLESAGICLDHRALGGPVFLDLTAEGMPLRQILGADGSPNLIGCALRDLLPLAPHYDEVVLLHDPELAADYRLLARALDRCGASARTVAVGRVPLDGRIASAREGGWQDVTADRLLPRLAARFGPAALRLGARVYFIAGLGPGDQQSFREDLLVHSTVRAERMLAAAEERAARSPAQIAERHRGGQHSTDPYRLTAGLLARHGPKPAMDLLEAVFL